MILKSYKVQWTWPSVLDLGTCNNLCCESCNFYDQISLLYIPVLNQQHQPSLCSTPQHMESSAQLLILRLPSHAPVWWLKNFFLNIEPLFWNKLLPKMLRQHRREFKLILIRMCVDLLETRVSAPLRCPCYTISQINKQACTCTCAHTHARAHTIH